VVVSYSFEFEVFFPLSHNPGLKSQLSESMKLACEHSQVGEWERFPEGSPFYELALLVRQVVREFPDVVINPSFLVVLLISEGPLFLL
jgi:hypothetical protein